MQILRLVTDVIVALALASALSAVGAADEPAPADRLSRLITNLGSNEYLVRETASEELARLGAAALAALEAGANHPDREVRYRSQRVLGQVKQNDLNRRLQEFLSKKESPGDAPLPGWPRFKNKYGDNAESRAVFVGVQRADPDLMKALDGGPRFAADTLAQRMSQTPQILPMGEARYTLEQIEGALFVAAEDDVRLPAQTMAILFSQCRQRAFREAMGTEPRSEIPRKMLGALISKTDDSIATQAMNLALEFNLPEGIVPAERILKSPADRRVGNMAPFALMTIARLGNASHLPMVENLLADRSLVTRMQEHNIVYEVQLRDEALAAAVLLTKQEIKDYFDIPAGQNVTEPLNIFFNARILGFSSEEQRADVFKKWDTYKAKQAKAGD